ncbi:MAG TPA: ABC transporter permease [Candidatus Polarisedimenticolia bacterium]|nr:ABC transporter permease [Candidatus Polarisedimenticolia bacterium]
MSGFLRDLRLAARRLAHAPGFSLAVVLTLALGMGANTTIFSFVHGVLLRPLPYPRPDRLVYVCETNVEQLGSWCAASPANASDWARRSRTLQAIGLARSWPFSVKLAGKTLGTRGGIATPGFFRAFEVKPATGRTFEEPDMLPGRQHVALVSHAFWRTHLGGEAAAVGRRLDIDSEPYEVIGVLPAGFEVQNLESIDLWIPLWPERQDKRDWRGFIPFARLADGATLDQAQSEMDTLRAQLAKEHPDTNAGWGVSVQSLGERITRPVRPALLIFLGAVGLVLLIACANVANLMLARSLAQEKEQAVRLALGANRLDLMRTMLSESLLLAAAGACVGALVAFWAVDFFLKLAPDWFPRLQDVHVSLPVLGFTILLSLLVSLLSGLIPALHGSSVSLQDALKSSRAASERPRGVRIRNGLVVGEIALSLLLLIAAGLLMRSFANLVDWQPGFDRRNLAIVPLFSSPGKYPEASQVAQLFRRAAEEVASVPSVVSVAEGSAVPLSGGDGEQEFTIEGRLVPPAGKRPSVAWFDVDPGYFKTLGIPLLRGRSFTPEDAAGKPKVAIINETMARRFWPDGNPIGQRLRMLLHQETFEIVGVVGDVRPFNPDERPAPQIYWPFAQLPRWAVQLIVRTSGDPEQQTAAIRARLAGVDPDMEIGRIMTMEKLVGYQLVNPRFNMTLIAIFAFIALSTAVLGVYGVMAFTVAQRTREIGIRLAMGAPRQEVMRLVVGKGLVLSAFGVAIGLGGAWGLTRLLRSLLTNLAPTDPLTFVVMTALLVLVSLAASYLPARRAATVDPIVVLRCE